MNPVWQAIATFIIRKRLPILAVLGMLTAFMWTERGTELVQTMDGAILTDDPSLNSYHQFREIFGDDGNVMVAALNMDLRNLKDFQGMYDLSRSLAEQEGVLSVFDVTKAYDLRRNDSLAAFELTKAVSFRPSTQTELDSLLDRVESMPFYRDLLVDESGETVLMAISLDPAILDTDRKVWLVQTAKEPVQKFADDHDITVRFAGLPVIRVNNHSTVKKELYVFLALALIVMAITLLAFFRSLYNVVFPILVVGIAIIFSMGLIGLMGYKMTLITGIIPALIAVISIPNCVYLITKYHIEYRRTNNMLKSLILVIEKIGIVTVMTNATTAIGLGVMAFTDIIPLREFGIVAGMSVVASFFISLLLIPIVFSFLPPPSETQTKHLDRKGLNFVIRMLDNTVQHRRWMVFTATGLIAAVSLYGLTLIKPVAFVMDDVPQDSRELQDLKYIENKFNGALPFEIMIDTRRKNGILRRKTLQRIEEMQDSLAKYEDLSRSMSVADFAKFSRQAYFGGGKDQYLLPTRNEFNFISQYVQNSSVLGSLSSTKTLWDSTRQITRISASVRDIGSLEMEALIDSIQKDVDAVFDPEKYDTAVTGTTQVFIKSNDALIENLLKSLLIAFCVIAVIMGLLFQSIRMVLISLIPNVLPLLMVAGIMGFFGIALKPSTALVFGVAFGIAVDDSIHYLARYRLARKLGDSIKGAVFNSFQDTGVSMMYTSIILFFGFVCFTASDFGGIKALGLLTSLTLGIAMFSNLLFLPALLLTFDKEEPKVEEQLFSEATGGISDSENISSNGHEEISQEEEIPSDS
ncbi:MMPL family transporter [Pontibacter sp. G13]|uniref:efflux RND transporter permease subunit n=1 Tax=Pontibacter sp. G13 TaxID=3074898 RepID=UPI00288C2ED2|nr:MMPL family transporter [Pontibacter sp. G13]WNJ16230.1 MMPL family transporter [Pontibacter sp. G13]